MIETKIKSLAVIILIILRCAVTIIVVVVVLPSAHPDNIQKMLKALIEIIEKKQGKKICFSSSITIHDNMTYVWAVNIAVVISGETCKKKDRFTFF